MTTGHYVCSFQDVSKTYLGGKTCFESVNLSFIYGAKIGVIGPNGAGKSTLLRIMAGIDKEFRGEVWVSPNVKVGYLSQEPQLDPSLTVRENIMTGVKDKKAILDEFASISEKMSEDYSDDLMEQMTVLQDKIDSESLWDLDAQVDVASEALRCPPDDADVTKLSGGERRRVALCQLLLEKPDILLLDEPTNHLDAETIAWLQNHLQLYRGTVLLITHDRYFLDEITNWILELDRGRSFPYEGNYSSWMEQKEKRLSHEARVDEAAQKTLQRELEWVRQSPKARQAKSKARLKSYNKLASCTEKERIGKSQIVIPSSKPLGSKVVDADKISKGYGDRLLIDNLSFSLPPGGIVGVIGPNGAGKTTLFRMLSGQDSADYGSLSIGDSVSIGYVDQSRDALSDTKTVWEEISDGADILQLGDTEVHSRAYCSWFNFKGSDQQKRVSQLSGGERNRVHMARLLRLGNNFLLLDEPTNDLDVETLRALEDGILGFPGCVMVISHDRWFLDRICTHILAFEGNSHVEWFEGNFDEYEEDKKRRLGPEAVNPHRIRYKKFER